MDTDTQTPDSPPLAAVTGSAHATLSWQKGPANGGVGTAGERGGVSQWYDGDLLLIIVETNSGREIAVVGISCDEDWFSVTDKSTGDEYDAWAPEQWAWWARLTDLPPIEPNNPTEL
jgi:endonuclease YncB( thermonuclease family)